VIIPRGVGASSPFGSPKLPLVPSIFIFRIPGFFSITLILPDGGFGPGVAWRVCAGASFPSNANGPFTYCPFSLLRTIQYSSSAVERSPSHGNRLRLVGALRSHFYSPVTPPSSLPLLEAELHPCPIVFMTSTLSFSTPMFSRAGPCGSPVRNFLPPFASGPL